MYNKDASTFFANGGHRRAASLIFTTLSLAFLVVIIFRFFDMKLPKFLFALPTIVLPTIAGSYDGYHSPYSFDVDYAHFPAWMSAFPNSTSLTTLSIPGTHDTMTSSSSLGPIYQCQNHHLDTQLKAGIRYIDIRGTVVNNEILIHHEDEYTGFTYAYVLKTLFSFLTSNPSEMVLMRLKEESTAINSTMSFEEAFNYYRLNDSETAPGCAVHFWIPASPGPTAVPTLGELRSKILIIQNFGPVPAPYGIKYESPLFVIEDDYALTDLGDMDNKFALIEENLLAAANSSAWNNGLGDGLIYLTHVSASVGVNPIDVAAGPLNKSVTGQNDRTGTWLSDHVDGNGTTGVVILDFPGEKLVEEILARN
jgi:1-phosphatidylinositol phosphodiesterase